MGFRTSVALCTYNGEKFIEEQIESILNQTRSVDQIIICDDCSTDKTVEVAERILSTSSVDFSVIRNEVNLGFIKNFEKSVSLCTGDIIFLCDQDDVWVPHKVETILCAFKGNETIELVFSDAYLTDEELNILDSNLWSFYGFKYNKYNASTFYKKILKRNVVTGATVAFKKSLLPRVTPFCESWAHDHWIAMLTSLTNSILPINERLIFYRQHSKNVYGAKRVSFRKRLFKYIKSLTVKNHYMKRYLEIKALVNYIDNVSGLDIYKLKAIKHCYSFWNEYNTKKRNLITILKNILNLNYFRYYSGFRAVIRDLVVLINNKA